MDIPKIPASFFRDNATHDWHDTISNFFNNSNENAVVLDYFNQSVLPILKQKFGSIRWLEIGCGDFSKSILMLRQLQSIYHVSNIELTIIEPSEVWKNHFHLQYEYQIRDSINVEFIQTKLDHNTLFNFPNFISLLHVLYDYEVTSVFFELLKKLKYLESDCVIFISQEDDYNDLAVLRKELHNLGLDVPKATNQELISHLESNRFNFLKGKTNGKMCRFDFSDLKTNANYWLFPFVLGVSQKKFEELSPSLRGFAIKSIQDYLEELGKDFLAIDDQTIIINTYGRHSS